MDVKQMTNEGLAGELIELRDIFHHKSLTFTADVVNEAANRVRTIDALLARVREL